MFKRFLNKLTRKLGFQIISVKNSYKPLVNNNHDPIYIEFMGVPGVGKSTLFNQISYGKNTTTLNNFIKMHKRNYDDKLIESQPIYSILAEEKLKEVLLKNFSSFDKLKILHFFFLVLFNDLILYKFNKNTIVVAEEGLFHNFGNVIETVRNTENKELLQNLFKNRAIVYCYSTPEKVAHQIMKRYEESGKLLPQHKTKNFEELVELQKQALKNKERTLDILKEFDIPVLMINTSNDTSENLIKINLFIKSLQKDMKE